MSNGGFDDGEILIAGTGHICVAATTVPLPTTLAALSSSWFDLGYTVEDGVTFGQKRDSKEVMSWQSKRPVRRFNASQVETISSELQQWNDQSLQFVFGGGTVTFSSGVYRYDFPDADDVDERAMVIDWVDGTKSYRLVVPKGTVVDDIETQLTRTAEATLPFSFAPSGDDPPYILTNDDNFSAIS